MKRDLYIDCDGVIFDTIETAYQEMKKIGINLNNETEIRNYFINTNWIDLIKKAGQINDSCNKILKLKESNIFRFIDIATHICSFDEGIIKDKEFKKLLPGINSFKIPVKIPKNYALKAENNILIDDAIEKINSWILAGGYGVLFDKNSGLVFPHDNVLYYQTNNLEDLILINEDIERKIKEKGKTMVR